MKYVFGAIANILFLGIFLTNFMLLIILPEPQWYTLPAMVIGFIFTLLRMKWTF